MIAVGLGRRTAAEEHRVCGIAGWRDPDFELGRQRRAIRSQTRTGKRIGAGQTCRRQSYRCRGAAAEWYGGRDDHAAADIVLVRVAAARAMGGAGADTKRILADREGVVPIASGMV